MLRKYVDVRFDVYIIYYILFRFHIIIFISCSHDRHFMFMKHIIYNLI